MTQKPCSCLNNLNNEGRLAVFPQDWETSSGPLCWSFRDVIINPMRTLSQEREPFCVMLHSAVACRSQAWSSQHPPLGFRSTLSQAERALPFPMRQPFRYQKRTFLPCTLLLRRDGFSLSPSLASKVLSQVPFHPWKPLFWPLKKVPVQNSCNIMAFLAG